MSNKPISLDAARKRKRRDGTSEVAQDTCPIVALGHENGVGVFLDVTGQMRRLTARQLGSRSDLAMLFLGDTAWLTQRFPKRVTRKQVVAGETIEETEIVGFSAAVAGEHLMDLARRAGIFGDHVVFRRSGIWHDEDGNPVVHCGDQVLIKGEFQPAGQKLGGYVWAAAAKTPRPDNPCSVQVGRELQAAMQELWTFKHVGGAIVALGLIGVGYLGAAATWRPSGYLTGGGGSGKSLLLNLMRACAPMAHYTNDTSKAGVEGAVNGRAMPIFIDEAADRVDQMGAQVLLDMVLSASSGEGTKGHRGTADGGVRSIDVVGVVVMASVSPPEMRPTHLSRFSLIELEKPGAGEDHRLEMEALTARMRTLGPALWARMLAGWTRWNPTLQAFRDALGRSGCAAREMDQHGTVLAGWWILTQDGLPNDQEALNGVAAIVDFVRRADEVAEDDDPQRVVNFLCSVLVQYDGTTRHEQIGTLLRRAYGSSSPEMDTDAEFAATVLAKHGIRPVRASAKTDRQGRPVPRLGDGDGLWLLPVAVQPLFRSEPAFAGNRWQFAVMRLPTARRSAVTVRVGGAPGKPIWLSLKDVDADWAVRDG